MEVEYENEPEDVRHLARALPKATVAASLLTMPLFALLSAVPAFAILPSSRFWAIGATGLAVAFYLAGWLFFRALNELRRTTFVPGKVRMRISPDFLELEHVDFRVRQSWLAVDSVSHVDHALVITYPLERYYIIEDRHFVSPEAAREFAAAASAYHAAARDIPTMDDSFLPEWTHDDQRFSVTYSNVATDWTGAMKSVGISRKTIYDYGVAFLFWAASNGLLAYLSYFDFGQRLKSGVITPFHALQQFALVAVILVFAYGTSFAMLMLVREVINRWRVPATLLTKRTVEITPRGVVERSQLSILALRWPAVGQVSFPFKLIHIRDLQQKSAIRIPFDAFPGLAQASDFSAHVDGWKRRDDLMHEEEKDSLPLAPMPDDENPYRSPQT